MPATSPEDRALIARIANATRLATTARLDGLLSAHWRPALSGDHAAASRVLELLAQHDKLLSLDQAEMTLDPVHAPEARTAAANAHAELSKEAP